MDLSKFIALIHDKALYFARSDKLGDPFEGSLPKKNREMLKADLIKDLGNAQSEISLSALSQTNMKFRTAMNMSCWHANEHESAAMWTLYGKFNDSICIQTTYRVLASALPKEVNAGLVSYIDYNSSYFNQGNVFNQFMHKRLSYEHEREFRAIIVSSFPTKNSNVLSESFIVSENGVKVPVDLNLVIKKIFVSPGSPNWFKETVESLRGRYNLSMPVVQSSLADDPIY